MKIILRSVLILLVVCGVLFNPMVASCERPGKIIPLDTVLSGVLTKAMLVNNSFKIVGYSNSGWSPITFYEDGTLQCKIVSANKWRIDKKRNQLQLFIGSDYQQREYVAVFKYERGSNGLVGEKTVGLLQSKFVIMENN